MRRLLCSADRFSDSATSRGSLWVKTPRSRSSALLCLVTSFDHRLFAVVLAIFWQQPEFGGGSSPCGDVEKGALIGRALAQIGVAVRAQDVDRPGDSTAVGALAGHPHKPRQ